MPSTPKTGYPYPAATDAPDAPGAIFSLAQALDDPAWTQFVSTTNINLGNGAANSGEWQRINNRVHFNGFMQLGSSFFVPPGVTLTLPTAARIGLTYPLGEFRAKKAGSAPVDLRAEFVNSTTIKLFAPATTGGTVSLVDVSATAPFAWAQTDTLGWSFSYAAN